MLISLERPWAWVSSSQERCAPSARLQQDHNWISQRIGEAPSVVRKELESRDFIFSPPEAKIDGNLVFAAAGRLIGLLPSLNLVVRSHVDAIFLLESEEQFDVTHSEPRWPEWVFISRPQLTGEVAALRTSENVVHEAMHLQLSLFEKRTPLVADLEATIRSPWKQEPRNLQGILHGLYVFVCISAFFRGLRQTEALSYPGGKYVKGRLAAIEAEISSISMPDLERGLTPAGSSFLRQLLPDA